MMAFAANSVLARLALLATEVDAATFAAVRLGAGALVLGAIARLRRGGRGGSWASATALFAYAAAFSFAYLSLATGTGALLLFGAVQITMIGAGLAAGERLTGVQGAGLVAALAGLVVLVAPGVEAPPLGGAALMAASGVAWGVYSLRGRRAGDPVAASAGNFWRAALLGVGLGGVVWVSGGALRPDPV
ncbi:MAG: EamA family transporter, partial [Bacteroidota bacterium]